MRGDARSRSLAARPPSPNPALRHLDKLVGTWNLRGHELGAGGEVRGQVSFEWLEGGFFLVQHVDVDHAGKRITGLEVIGYGRRWGEEEPGEECTSHFFDSVGDSFEYVYEVGEDTITVRGGHGRSAVVFRGRFSEDRSVITGAWEWSGGGYEVTLKKVM